MLAKPGEQDREGLYFNPVMKCCSYVPDLHNFLAGAILDDDDPQMAEGRKTVEARIRAGVGVTPLGLEPPADYTLLYRHGTEAFGRSQTLRCPHYIEAGGRCGIWKHRESTCATWFCKYERGSLGHLFWREHLHPLLAAVEHHLAIWCALELGLELDALHSLLAEARAADPESLQPEQIDRRPEPEKQRRIWGNWRGREMEWYRACAGRVRNLSWRDTAAICGCEVAVLARLAQKAYRELLDPQLPERLEPAPFELVQIETGRLRVVGYSRLDPLDLPAQVFQVLHYFRGRNTRAAVQAIQQEENIALSDDLILKLKDFGILQAPGPGG